MMSSGRKTADRVGRIAAACWLLPVAFSLISGQDTVGGRVLGNLSSLLFAPLFVLLAVALGDWLLSRILKLNDAFTGRWLFAAGLGLGAFAIGTLLAGCIFIPRTFVAWIGLVMLAAALSARAGGLLLRLRDAVNEFLGSRDWPGVALLFIIGLLVCLNLLRAFVPPLEYDEMEYHLAAPAKYVRDGRISFVSNNAYASFPANIEMLFLDAMVIRGGVIEGLALGRLINIALGLLAACAAGACASAMFTKRAALPAAAILYTWPSVNHLTHVAYVELGLMFYVGLALLAAYQYSKAQRKIPHLVLLGVACGLAAGCKYPAALFVCVPAGLWVLISAGRGRARHGLIVLATALIVFSPWLIRNTVHTGNPVYPLLWRTFGGGTWSERKDARWQKAHSARDLTMSGMWRSIRATATERRPAEGGPRIMSFLLIAFLPLAFFEREWRAKGAVLLLLTLLCVAVWLLLTHRISRFLVPWLVPLVALNGAGAVALGQRKWLRIILAGVLVVLVSVEARATLLTRAPRLEVQHLIGGHNTNEFLKALGNEGWNYSHGAILFVNSLPHGSRVLFYGEAETLYCTADVIAPTVFDENPLDEIVRSAESPEDILAGLKALGVTHIYVNLVELHRLQWSYAFTYEGRLRHGYNAFISGEAVRGPLPRFLATRCEVVYPAVPQGRPKRALDRGLLQTMSHHDREHPPMFPIRHFVYEIRRP